MVENRNPTNIVKKSLSQIFVGPSSVPPFLEYFVTLFEFFVFTIFVSSNTWEHSLIFQEVIQRNLIMFLSSLFLLRYLTRLTLIKSIYVMILVWNIQCSLSLSSVIVYGLLFIHVLIDIISKIQFSFQTKNIHTSTYPWFIALHYVIITAITVLRFFNLSKDFIFPLSSFVSFGLLIIVQYRSIVKYEDFKNLHLRFYFLSMFYAIAEFYEIFVAKQPLAKSIFAVCASQLFYQFIQWKTKTQFTVEEYISKKMEIQAGFYIFGFLYSKSPISNDILKAIRTLSNEDTNCLIEQKTFKESMMNTKRGGTGEGFLTVDSTDTKEVSIKLANILKQNSSIYAQIFLAQITLYELNQHVKCRQILSSLQRKTSFYNILSKILINKIQRKLLAHLQIEHDKCITPNFYEFIENDKFRNLLLKSSLNFIDLWQYTKVKEGIYKRINELAQKVIKAQQKIHQCYQNLKVKCIKMNLLYGNYLFCVERNTELANEIMENLYFYQEKEQNLECDNKVYIKIGIHSNDPLKISAVGSNVNKHLGYERRLMVGMNLNVLLPEFYKEFHDNLVADVLQNQTQRLFLFSKSTILKHAKGNYVTALICLRITYDGDGELFLQGFIKIHNDQKHNWHNYLFVKHNTKEIVECSMLVNDKISQGKGKKFNADEFFDNLDKDFHKKIQKFTSDLNKYFYEPVISFESGEEQVTLFVELDPYAESIEQRVQHDKHLTGKRQILIPEMIVYPKYKVFDNIKHFLRKKISTRQILCGIKTKMKVLNVMILVLILGIYVLEGVNVNNINAEYENKIDTMIITDNIVKHYMGLSKIGVDLSYLVVNELYGYDFPEFNISLKESIMTVQQTNEYFKQYSQSEWEYQSLSSVLEYRTCYKFISEVLASASFIDQVPSNPEIKANMIAAYNELFTETFVWSYPEYTSRIQVELAKKSQNRDLIQIIKIVVLFVLCSILYIFLIKVQSSSRVSEHQTLKFIGSITFQDQVIEKTKQFIYTITQEKVQNLTNTKTLNFATTLNKDFINEGIKMSEISARQSTGRDLMGNMSGRETFRSDLSANEAANPQTQDFPIKLRSPSKTFIIIPLILIIMIIALQVSNYVLNIKMREINEAESSRNIVEWMNKPLFFTRLVNAFLTEDRGPQFTDHDKTFYKTYKYFQDSYNSIASFDQINYSEFADFEQKLRKIRFEYLCTYAKCPDTDRDYVNILYTTTMQKLAGYMLANQYFLNDPKNKMDTIMISEQLFRQIMTDLIQTYIQNYKEYAKNYKGNQFMFIMIIIGALSLMFLTLVLQVYLNVYKSMSKHFRICDIIKQDSYLINKDSLISFEQQELEKQKNEQKKKLLIKKANKDKDNQSEISENKSKIVGENEYDGKKTSNSKDFRAKGEEKDRKLSIFKELQKNKK